MFARYRKLFAEVRASYTPEKAADERQSEFLAHVLHRPLSFLVTPFFLMAGFSADGVTAVMFAAALAMPVAAGVAGGCAFIAVAALVLCAQVLDCVDGNVARVTGRSTPVGGMLDGLCSLLFWTLYFISIGLLARGDTSWVARHGTEIGLSLAVLLLAQREMEDTFDDRFGERVRTEPITLPPETTTQTTQADAGPRTGFDLRQAAKFAEQSIAVAGPLIAGAFGAMSVFLALLALYQITVFSLWFPRYVRAIMRRRG